jgi:hypothetical protein
MSGSAAAPWEPGRACFEVVASLRSLARIPLQTGKPWGITRAVRASIWTGEFDRMYPPSHTHRVAELLGGDAPVTVVQASSRSGCCDLRGSAAIRNTQRSLKHPLFAKKAGARIGGCDTPAADNG